MFGITARMDHRKTSPLAFAGIVLLAVLTRLYGLFSPLTDGGHERQTQVAMIARNLFREGYNVLFPRMDTFAPDPGFIALEFPLQPLLMALLHNVLDNFDLCGRFITLLFSVASIWFMLGVARFFLAERYALLCAGLYALTPMSIYFGRAVFPEALMLFFSLASLFFLLRWYHSNAHTSLGLSILLFAIAALVKAPILIMLLPTYAIFWSRWRWDLFRSPVTYVYGLLSMLPLAGWMWWGNQIGPADPGWNTYQLSVIHRLGIPGIWLDPTLYLQLAKSIGLVTLTPAVTIAACVGIRYSRGPLQPVLHSWTAAMALFVMLTAGAQISHWNYQVPLIPWGALLAAVGVQAVVERRPKIAFWHRLPRLAKVGCLAILGLVHLAIYTRVAHSAYEIDRRIPYARIIGEIVQREFPRNGFLVLIQPAMVPATQSYYMDRAVRILPAEAGGSVSVEELERWRALGATGVVIADTPYGSGQELIAAAEGVVEYLETRYRLVAQHPGYRIYSALRSPAEVAQSKDSR